MTVEVAPIGRVAEVENSAFPMRMQKGDRRASILDTAILLIGEQGFGGFSINALAKRCGLTTAGLLHHFGSKHGLMIALLDERDRRDREALIGMLGVCAHGELSKRQVLYVLRAIVSRNAEQPDLVRLNAMIRAEALQQDHPAAEYFKERETRVRSIIADMVRPHVSDAEATAIQVLSLMNGLEAQWIRDGCTFDLVEYWDAAAAKLITQNTSL
jgi:AcrR family transcriptional regulator